MLQEKKKMFSRKLLKLISEFGKLAKFLYTNKLSERETKETIPLTITSKRIKYLGIVVAQSLSHVRLFATPNTLDCSTPGSPFFTIFQSSLRFMSIELVTLSNHLILCCPLLLLPSIFPSIRVFSSESALCIRWPKYWSFSFTIRPSNEYSGLISFRIDWLGLLAVPGTLKVQHHNLK